MTPSENEPTTFQLEAQCLNQLCYCVPQKTVYIPKIEIKDPFNIYLTENGGPTSVQNVGNHFPGKCPNIPGRLESSGATQSEPQISQ
jgi:hypothetical protein